MSGPRFTYKKITAKEFTAELDRRGMTLMTFVRLFGVGERTAERWASGDQDIPTWVPIALTLMTLDGALGTARMAAAAMIETDNLRPELGKFPYRTLRSLPEDASDGA